MPGRAYVYEHWRPDKDVCFYVGKGTGKRARDNTRNPHHANITAKLRLLGLRVGVRIIANNLSNSDAFALERDRIAFWRDAGIKLANLTDGGDGPTNPTEEVRQKIRDARKRQVFSAADRERHRASMQRPETRALLSAAARNRKINSFKGRSHTQETRAKWSAERKGRKLSPEHRAKISAGLRVHNGFKGRCHSAETRARISAHNKTRDLSAFTFRGKTHSTETKAKISLANTGRILSPQTRAKISAARRAVHATPAAQ